MSDVADIALRLDELEKKFSASERERDEYRRLYLEMMERCRKLELGLRSSQSEHLPKDDAQLSLSVLSMVLDERQRAELDAALAAAEAEQEIRGHTRKKTHWSQAAHDRPRILAIRGRGSLNG